MVQRTRDREEMIQRIGRVLHDKVVANLDAIEKNAQVLGVEAKGHENGFVKDLVSDIRGAARESMALLRNLVYDELLDPYPVRIDREGLVAAIQQDLVPQVQARYRPLVAMTLDSGNVRDSELNIQLDGVTRRTLFAAVEEAVRNAVKHGSKPGRLLRIAITLGWDDGVLMITVADNGAGFHPELAVIGTQGMGLRYHQAALRFTGGVLAIESQPGHGATVRVRMPLHAPRSITDNATMRTLAPIRHV
jgi:signal transduction histidine kinase